LTFDLGPEMAADEMAQPAESAAVPAVEDDLFGMEEESTSGEEPEQEEDLWSEVSLSDNAAPLIEDNVLEDESFWGTGSEDDGVATPLEPQAASSEVLLEDMDEPEILDLTDEAEAPIDVSTEMDIFGAETAVTPPTVEESAIVEPEMVEEAVAPVEPEMVEEAVAPVELEMVEEAVAPVELEMVEEAVAPVELEMVEEAVAPVEPEMMEEAVAPVELEMMEEAVVPPEPEIIAESVSPPPPSGTAGAAVSKDELEKVIGVRIEEAVRGILGPVINEAARKIVEEVAWDVIPDLAEAMIRSEIERIRKTG
jgi:hypothetical protein